MTKKQEKILNKALELFAEKGYHSTSTSTIAKEAGVSEGLIFRHFKNKDGLLKAILDHGKDIAQSYFEPIVNITDPKQVIAAIIEIPFRVDPVEHTFWRLVYTLKWQQHEYDRTANDMLNELAIKAFTKLNYPNPKAEAEILEIIMDGAATAILLKENLEENETLIKSLKLKYNIDETV